MYPSRMHFVTGLNASVGCVIPPEGTTHSRTLEAFQAQ